MHHTFIQSHLMDILCHLLNIHVEGFPDSSVGKESSCNARDPGSIPGSERSAGKGIGYPLQYSGEFHGLYNPWAHKESDTTERLSLSCTLG